jgi:Cytochrome c
MVSQIKHIAAYVMAAAVVLFCAGQAIAQDDAKVKTGLESWKKAGCPDCHGSFADGDKQRDESPSGPNLRTRTRLDAAALKQVIGCGRPGTEMPAFEEGAYTARACYGRPLGEAPSQMYPAPAKLTPAEVDAVVAYLQARIIGRGPITLAECLAYYDAAQASWCDSFK